MRADPLRRAPHARLAQTPRTDRNSDDDGASEGKAESRRDVHLHGRLGEKCRLYRYHRRQMSPDIFDLSARQRVVARPCLLSTRAGFEEERNKGEGERARRERYTRDRGRVHRRRRFSSFCVARRHCLPLPRTDNPFFHSFNYATNFANVLVKRIAHFVHAERVIRARTSRRTAGGVYAAQYAETIFPQEYRPRKMIKFQMDPPRIRPRDP